MIESLRLRMVKGGWKVEVIEMCSTIESLSIRSRLVKRQPFKHLNDSFNNPSIIKNFLKSLRKTFPRIKEVCSLLFMLVQRCGTILFKAISLINGIVFKGKLKLLKRGFLACLHQSCASSLLFLLCLCLFFVFSLLCLLQHHL